MKSSHHRSVFPGFLVGLALLAFAGLSRGQESGAKLHVIIVADTQAEDIGPGVIQDVRNWEENLSVIAKHTGLTLSKTILKDEHRDRKTVVAVCRNLTVGSDDAVLFCFSGHGFHTKSMKTQWPALTLKDEEWIELYAVQQMLSAKKPRLLLVLADCCNNLIPEFWTTKTPFGAGMASGGLLSPRISSDHYRRLFVESAGSYIASGCRVSQFSWSTKSGGKFTIRFLDDLESAVTVIENRSIRRIANPGNANLPSWDKIFNQLCEKPIHKNGADLQQPQFQKIPVP